MVGKREVKINPERQRRRFTPGACKGSDHANAMNEKKMPQVLPHYSGLEAVF